MKWGCCMEYLHKNRRAMADAVNLTSNQRKTSPSIVEKDYYVTMVLRELAKRTPFVVFKGGTSLSKCYHIIRRFSEDIDIAVVSKPTQGQMKHLKQAICETAEVLGMTIPNLEATRSRRSYNRYILNYDSVVEETDPVLKTSVVLETSFAEAAFPTEILPVHSYLGEMIQGNAPDLCGKYGLEPFSMKVQRPERTLVDKVFAICDYYLEDKCTGHSRHIYDIYKLVQVVPMEEAFGRLVAEVRAERKKNQFCPAAQDSVDVSELLMQIIESSAYKRDYETVTVRLLEEEVPYETAVAALRQITKKELF